MMRAIPGAAGQSQSAFAPSLAMAAAGGLGVVAGDLTPLDGPIQFAGAGLIAGSFAGVLMSWRARERQRLLDDASTGLVPLVGRGPSVEVRASAWKGPGVVGAPSKVRVTYDPAVIPTPDWLTKVKDQLEVRFDRTFEVAKHDTRRHRITFRPGTPPVIDEEPAPVIAERALGMVENLLGAGATHRNTWDGQDLVAVEVTHDVGIKVTSSTIRSNIEKVWQAMLPGRWRAHWDLERDSVRFEIRPKIPAVLERSFEPVPEELVDKVEYAVDEDGTTLYWNLSPSAAQPHCLITGGTGAGKTNTMRGIITGLTRRGSTEQGKRLPPRVLLCDPKRIEFAGFRGWPNVEIVATSVPDIVATIRYVFLEMERRYALIESGECATEDFPRLVLVVDEFRYFYGVCNTWYAGVKGAGGTKECPIFNDFFAIASLGRSAGVHLLLGTQRPDAYWLGGDVRDQFAARYSLGRLSPEGARMMWGSHSIGVSVPRGIPGRGTSVLPDGTPVECQSYWTPDPRSKKAADQEILAQLRPTTSYWPQHVIVPPAEVDDEGQPIDPKGRYNDYANAEYAPAADHPDLVAALTSAKTMLAAPVAPDPSEAVAKSGPDKDYGEPVTVRAADAIEHEGWLLLVDEASDTWGVIESIEQDRLDEDHLIISWRSDQDDTDEGLLAADSGGHLVVREPTETKKP